MQRRKPRTKESSRNSWNQRGGAVWRTLAGAGLTLAVAAGTYVLLDARNEDGEPGAPPAGARRGEEAAARTEPPRSDAGAVPVPPGDTNPVAVLARNGVEGFVYRVPAPGDPDHADYREMLRHPRWARQVRPGAVIYYDPEWRAEVRGRREVEKHGLRLTGAMRSVEEVVDGFLRALAEEDNQALNFLRTTRDEFQLILWPEFPTSRPFLRVPAADAWAFQFATLNRGAAKAMTELGGRNLGLLDFHIGKTEEYTNFRLLLDVIATARDEDTGEELEIDMLNGIVECRGEYKVYLYKD